MKLHVGCGGVYIPGFRHLDILDFPHVDYRQDLRDLSNFTEGSVDLIYACHVLEHFGRHEVQSVLSEWSRVLRKGGKLRLAVPDFEAVCTRYCQTHDLKEVLGLVVGGQKDEFDYHFMAFDFSLLETGLRNAGFTEVCRYNWWNTEHHEIDDYAQAYLPHMDKANGDLMSLNVEAIK
jgi:predicted SAM-dependent methyltransferase